jgi:hypothetical protein
MPPRRSGTNTLYQVLKAKSHHYRPEEITTFLQQVSQDRIDSLASSLGSYISTNLPAAINRRSGLQDYRTNPYVLLTCANVMKLSDPLTFANFLFNNKLYMGLETSFGKSIESTLVGPYPIIPSTTKWIDPPEKIAEQLALAGLTNEEKARVRNNSIWREIDKSCVVGNKRFLVTIKSGPNCINDTQVGGMKDAIANRYMRWLEETRTTYPEVTSLDIIVGITYGTNRTTNNKENQILVKLLEYGFEEENRDTKPGILIDSLTKTVRVYRCIGQEFWALIGNPVAPETANSTFLEVLIALSKALSVGITSADIETALNLKLQELSLAFGSLMFPRNSLPTWIRNDFSEHELFWMATAMTAFYDEGI